MTEERIREILLENDAYLTIANIEAMKKAVNEAIQECADKAEIGGNHIPIVNKQSILKLKVK